MITVYGRPDSSAVARVMWTIGELGLAHTRIDWGGKHGGNDDPDYRAMNPAGRIPAIKLETGDALWESNAIIRYLTALHDTGGLMPADPLSRAQAEAWMDWAAAFANAVSAIRKAYKRADATEDGVNAAIEGAVPTLGILERRLGRHTHVSGDTLTVADIALGVWAHRLARCPDDLPLPALPNTRAWIDRLRERPAYREHVVEKVSAGAQAMGLPPAS